MFMIVVFHGVTHINVVKIQGVWHTPMNASFSLNQIVGFVLGSWGCLGVGCFFLLSAYFTVGKSRFKTLKISKIIFQTIFWSFAMFFYIF